jgi:hypothetical protein
MEKQHKTLPPPATQEKREVVRRAMESEVFCKAPAMRAFLLYITEQAELGHADRLKEQIIGVEVLGRRPGYDPAQDNIVRVRANELRGRLARYFASEGAQESLVITIPKGGYAPEFVHREFLSALPAEKVLPISEAVPEAPAKGSRFWLTIACLAVLIAAVGYFSVKKSGTNSRILTESSSSTPVMRDFWGQFFPNRNGAASIIYSDSGIALWQRLNHTDLNLGDYLSHKYLDSHNDQMLEIASQRSTSPADINVSLRIQGIAATLGSQISTQFARNINTELLHRGNLVLIGSRRSNPWVEIYEPRLNFQLRIDPKTQSPEFFNRSTRPNESSLYGIPDLRATHTSPGGQFIEEAEEKEFVSYGVVALLKECGTNRVVLLLEGLNMQATQAAGDLVTDQQMLGRLLDSIGHKLGVSVSPFEALFQVTSLPGGYDNPRVIATRLQPAEACFTN